MTYVRHGMGGMWGDLKADLEAKQAEEFRLLQIPGPNHLCPPFVPQRNPKDGWWFFADRTKPGGGLCLRGDAVIRDHRDTATTGTVKVTTISNQGSTVTQGAKKDPYWNECVKKGLPVAECYKMRSSGKSLAEVQNYFAQKAATDQATAEALVAAQKAARTRNYLLYGGIAAAAVVAFTLLRK